HQAGKKNSCLKKTCISQALLLISGTMFQLIIAKDPVAVQVEVQAARVAMFPSGDALFVPLAFGWAIECFEGRYRDYQAVDARYHDFEHTLQGTLCMARLLRTRHL